MISPPPLSNGISTRCQVLRSSCPWAIRVKDRCIIGTWVCADSPWKVALPVSRRSNASLQRPDAWTALMMDRTSFSRSVIFGLIEPLVCRDIQSPILLAARSLNGSVVTWASKSLPTEDR